MARNGPGPADRTDRARRTSGSAARGPTAAHGRARSARSPRKEPAAATAPAGSERRGSSVFAGRPGALGDPLSSVIYWDASAILSALFTDSHSSWAQDWSLRPSQHLVTSLGWAEVHAVAGRLVRQELLTRDAVDTARTRLRDGPWRAVHVAPSWDALEGLAGKWSLRGADLWHLAAATGLAAELPELVLLTFDRRLLDAANGEGIGPGDFAL